MSVAETDRGAAAERTRLAWRRTTLAVTVVALLLGRLALQHQTRAVALVVGAAAGLCWVVLLSAIQRRIAVLGGAALTRPARPFLMLTAAACSGLGLLGVVLVLA